MTEQEINSLFRDRYIQAVRFLQGRGEDFDTAEDMVQTAFAQMAFSEIEITQPVSYLFKACRNRMIDVGMMRNRWRKNFQTWKNEQVIPSNPEDLLIRAEEDEIRAAKLASVLDPLSQRERKLLLCWAEGTQQRDELARISGLSPKSIGTTMVRLRAKVRAAAEQMMLEEAV